MTYKKVSFMEALLLKRLGYEIYGRTENDLVRDWSPKNQNMVSWNAIERGEWFYIDHPKDGAK